MSKIICDVCGTSYPENATQCPICGCVRSGDPITVAGDTNEADIQPAATYTYVKGGRFSKSNVKKRNSGKPVYNAEPIVAKDDKKPATKKGEGGLVAIVVVLLLAIAAVVIYIALSVFGVEMPSFGADKPVAPIDTQNTNQSIVTTVDTTIPEIHCTKLEVSDSVVEFDKQNAAQLLNVKAYPEDQTDEIVFTSEDTKVATVDAKGKITAVGHGQTVITIQCGDQIVECSVVCNIPEETTVPVVKYTAEDFKFYNSDKTEKDLTFPLSDKSFKLYTGKIPAELITWESDNEKVAVFVDGLLTFVGAGVANVKVTYEDMTYECIIRVY